MKNLTAFLTFFLLFFVFSACEEDALLEQESGIEQITPDFSNVPNCGTPAPTQEVINSIIELRDNNKSNQRYSWMTYTIPIYVHFVRRSNGATNYINANGFNSTLTHNHILASIQRTNQLFKPMKIEFVAARFNFIDNDNFYNYTNDAETQELALKNNEPGYINMYFYPNTQGSWASFPDLDWDFVAMSYDHTKDPSTMAHELGHYLNLLHTHETYRGAETVAQTNCFERGDFLCDTPADPDLTNRVNSSCNYQPTGRVEDSNNTPYNPLTNNIMSYAPASCATSFTTHQINLAKMTLVNERKYLITIKPSYGIGLYRPSTNDWYFDHDLDKTTDRKIENWGYSGDLPVSGNFTGNGNSIAIYRPSGGDWYIDYNKDGKTDKIIYNWGRNGDLPVAGNFTGTRYAGIALYRPSTGTWYFDDNLDGRTDRTLRWGSSYHKAAAGDFNGDGNFDIALYNPRNGNWALDFNMDGKTDKTVPNFGASTDRPFAGDFNGDGYYDLAVYRPSNYTWYFDTDLDGDNNFNMRGYGRSGDLPIAIK